MRSSIRGQRMTSDEPTNQDSAVASFTPQAASGKRKSKFQLRRECVLLSLPDDILDSIFANLEYDHLFRSKAVCKEFKARIEGCGFNACRGSLHLREAHLTALHLSVRLDDGVLRCAGYDLITKSWMKLPHFAALPRLEPELFKDYLICAAGGMMCVYVSASNSTLARGRDKIIVFNPLTGRSRELPSLKPRRSPVLMHMVVNPAGDSFKVVVAGSADVGDEHLSRLTQVFDSRTSTWTVTQDLPGPVAGLNEYQTCAYVNGVLYCIAFQDGGMGRGILAYNGEEGKWLPDLSHPLPVAKNVSIVQVANINGEVVVFSEIERNPCIFPHSTFEHRIDVLASVVVDTGSAQLGAVRRKWRNMVTETKPCCKAGLQTYPEYSLVPIGEGKVCVFNTMAHTGVIYDVQNGRRIGKLGSPAWNGCGGMLFHSMNPLTFSFEPSFKGHRCLQLTPTLKSKFNLQL